MNQRKTTLYILKVALVTIVFGFLIYHTHIHINTLWIIPIYLIIGYYFGKLTCGTHSKKYGIWLTLGLFILLNFIHSLFDGILSLTISDQYQGLAIISHELIRQPALYVVIWSMLAPFGKRYHKIVMSILAVTGVWMIGLYIGTLGISFIHQLSSISDYISITIFIFAGDIIHHLIDEYVDIRNYKKTTI
ncbi:MAG TPA: hypothetical protein PKZ56_01680 [Candidatus Paceibacterota bacterium]|nr:hypothetical protein [Candidatus Paceibacterota bacterium]